MDMDLLVRLPHEIWTFTISVFMYWQAYLFGAVGAVMAGVYKKIMNQEEIPASIFKVGAICFLMMAVFLTWQKQYHRVVELEEQANPKLEITTQTPDFVNKAMGLKVKPILLAVTNPSTTSAVKNVELTIRDIYKINDKKLYVGDANIVLPLLDNPNTKLVTINAGDTKYFVFEKLDQSNRQPLHIFMGNFYINKNEKFNFRLTYSGENSPAKNATLYLEYSDTEYEFGIVGKNDYVRREIPVFGRRSKDK